MQAEVHMDFARPFTGQSFFLIAGPCVIESREHAHLMASSLRDLAEAIRWAWDRKSTRLNSSH